MMEDPISPETTIIMSALSTLTPPQLSHLATSLSSLFHRHHHRLSSILSSPTLFPLTLNYLHSLSLPTKSLLIARHLLSHLTHFFPTPTPALLTTTRDLDAVLLLLLFCEIRHQNPHSLETSPTTWQSTLSNYLCDNMLTISGIGVSNYEVLIHYIDKVAKCPRFVNCGDKEGREVAASVEVVVGLPSVEVSGGGRECVICKEEMRQGEDACELPCDHLFHFMCILPWLNNRNTCPCCRYQLPTDDVLGEIQRLWEVLIKTAGLGQ